MYYNSSSILFIVFSVYLNNFVQSFIFSKLKLQNYISSCYTKKKILYSILDFFGPYHLENCCVGAKAFWWHVPLLPFTAEPTTNFTRFWKVIPFRHVVTLNSNKCGSSHTTAKPRKFEVDRWAPSTSIDCARSIRCRRRFGTAKRPSTASKNDRETPWRNATWEIDIPRRTRRKISRRRPAWRWLRCLIGSRIVGNEIARRKRDRKYSVRLDFTHYENIRRI